MEETRRGTKAETPEERQTAEPVSETWAQDTLEDLDEFIESQGIYIRQ